MGRGQRQNGQGSAASADGAREVSPESRGRVEAAHYEEHRESFWDAIHAASEAIREARGIKGTFKAIGQATERVGNSLGTDGKEVRKRLIQTGLVSLAAGAGAATIAPAAALLAPVAGAALAWKAYDTWNGSLLWRNSTLGRALARTFGADSATGRIHSIAGTLAKRSLPALAAAGASSLFLGTPLMPVAAAAIGGYAAMKAAQVVWRKRKYDQEEAPAEMPSEENLSEENPSSTETGTATQEGGSPQAPPTPSSDSESEESVPETSLSDRIGLVRASKMNEESGSKFEAAVLEELGQEARVAGKNFSEGLDPEAAEARMLSYLAESELVPEDESGDEVRALVAKSLAEEFHEGKGSAKRVKEAQSLIDEAESTKQSAIMAVQEIDEELQEMQQSGGTAEEFNELLEERAGALAVAQEASQREALLRADLEARSSATQGQIDGLSNLVALGGELRCSRCGTRPQTFRQRCSQCGLPFVVPSDKKEYVGIGEQGLREKGKMDIIERHEGSAEVRARRRAERIEGRLYVPEEPTKESPSSEKESQKEKSAEKVKPQSSQGEVSAQQDSAPSLAETISKGLDGSQEDYIAERNRAREEAGSAVRVAGLGRFSDEEMARIGEEKDQASCVVDGQFPMDFGASMKTGNLDKTEVGDRVMIRQNSGASFEEKNDQRLLGYADVRGVASHQFTAEEMQDPEAIGRRLGEIWDENGLGDIQDIYTRERFIEYNTNEILYGDGTPEEPRPRPNFTLVLYENEQRFDSPVERQTEKPKDSAFYTQGPGKSLREAGPEYQEAIDASYARDYAVGSQKNGAQQHSQKDR